MKTSILLFALVGSFVSAQDGSDNSVTYGASGSGDGNPLALYTGNNNDDSNTVVLGDDSEDPTDYDDTTGDDSDDDDDDEYPSSCVTTLYQPATQTITATTTSTWCPVCDDAKTNGLVYTTTYETVYASVCPTGITSVTYVVTQECTGTTEIDTATCPPGFVETTTSCPGSTADVTITVPCPVCHVTPAAYNSNVLAVATPSADVAAASGPEATGAAPGAEVAAAGASPSSVAGANVAAASYQPFEGKAASSAITGLLTVGAGFGSVFLAMLLL